LRITIVISSPELVRNYLSSNALVALAEKHDLNLFYNKSLSIPNNSLSLFKAVETYETRDSFNLSRLIQDLHMLRWKSKSSGFRYRIKRKYPSFIWEILRISKQLKDRRQSFNESSDSKKFGSILKNETKFIMLRVYLVMILVTKQTKKIFLFTLAEKHLFPLTIKSLYWLRTKNYEIHSYFERNHFDLLLYPSSAYEPELIDIISGARNSKIKSLMLIDNWDNLSSKTVISHRPDFIATWGEQSTHHAVSIQGFAKEKCFNLGTPRIDSYFFERVNQFKAPLDYKYILVVGSSAPYDEAGLIYKLDYEIAQNPEIYGLTRVLYRPHPLRSSLDKINFENLKKTDLDPSVASSYLRDNNLDIQNIPLPELEGYSNLISNSSIVISGITSMMIEASIFNKKCLVMGFEEASNITSPAKMLSVYPHFDGIENLPNLTVCRDAESIIYEVAAYFRGVSKLQKYSKDKLNYFIYSDEVHYPARLLQLAEKVVNIKI
jgi:hypothetical protein